MVGVDISLMFILTGNKDVALEMLNAGMAWHYTKYDQSEKYHNAEIKSKE